MNTQNTTGQHTPEPWHVATYGEGHNSFMAVKSGSLTICRTVETFPAGAAALGANTRRIVHCVNQHDALVAALQKAVERFDFTVSAMAKGQTVSISSLQDCAADARAALAKAKQL